MKLLLSIILLLLVTTLFLMGISLDSMHAQDDPTPTPDITTPPESIGQNNRPSLRIEYSMDILTLENIGSEIIQYDNLTFQGDIAGNFEATIWSLNFGNELASGECVQLVADLSAYAQPDCNLIGWVRYTESDLFWSAFSGNATFMINDHDTNIATCDVYIGEAKVCDIDLSIDQGSTDEVSVDDPDEMSAFDVALQGVNSNAEWEPYTQTFGEVEMVLVPAGCFMMGSDDGGEDETPVHEICFDEPFWIDRYEVTNDKFEFGLCSSDPNNPICMWWFGARDHCLERGGRLPTEAEWEYSARGPDNLIYPWGNEWEPDNLNAESSGNNNEVIVGSYPADQSWVGALDMAGNIREWTSTIDRIVRQDPNTNAPITEYESKYPYTEDDRREDQENPDAYRVIRGGFYRSDEDDARTSFRYGSNPNLESAGFRCVMDFESRDASFNNSLSDDISFEMPIRPDNLSQASVERVIDGDTLELNDGRRIRLIGINAPERDQAFYDESLSFLQNRVNDNEIFIEFDMEEVDQFGRTLAYIWVDNDLINAEILFLGLAYGDFSEVNNKYQNELRQAELSAQNQSLGIWQ